MILYDYGGCNRLIVTMEHVDILNQTDLVTEMILKSDVMNEYKKAKESLNTDSKAQSLIKAFEQAKVNYEEVQRFGNYHPDYYEIMRHVRSVKRKMDMNEKVAKFKIAERQLQNFLDKISQYIAESVSEHIKVPVDGAALTDGGCSTGSCGSGGQCGCQAS